MGSRVAAALIAVVSCAAPVAAQISSSTYVSRRVAAMARLGSDVLVVPARASFPEADQRGLLQTADFQYLTGLEELVGALLVLDGSTSTSILFVAPERRGLTLGTLPPGAVSAQRLALSDVLPSASLEPWLRRRFRQRPTTVYVASTDARGAVEAPLPIARSILQWEAWLTALGTAHVRLASSVLAPLREIKDPGELTILRRVGTMSRDAALAAIRAIAPGTAEHVAELAVVNACGAGGARGVSFWPWTLSGPNAVFPSTLKSFVAYDHMDRVRKPGELVRVDVGCQMDHYMGDVGRTVPVSGTFTEGQREAWDLFIAAYRAGLGRIRDGSSARSIQDGAAAEVRRQAGSLRTSEGRSAAAVLLGPTATDLWTIHGVGLSDAEPVSDLLRAGMVIAYEPMFIVDGDAFYLEDMLVVTREGYELLTPGLPYRAHEIETVMAKSSRPAIQ